MQWIPNRQEHISLEDLPQTLAGFEELDGSWEREEKEMKVEENISGFVRDERWVYDLDIAPRDRILLTICDYLIFNCLKKIHNIYVMTLFSSFPQRIRKYKQLAILRCFVNNWIIGIQNLPAVDLFAGEQNTNCFVFLIQIRISVKYIILYRWNNNIIEVQSGKKLLFHFAPQSYIV